jgi:addiction module HigA family antidote
MIKKTKLLPIHPGQILLNQFMLPLELSQNRLARELHVPVPRINAIVKGSRAITPETALRLGRFFGNSPEFWLNLQQRYDLQTTQDHLSKSELESIEPIKLAA